MQEEKKILEFHLLDRILSKESIISSMDMYESILLSSIKQQIFFFYVFSDDVVTFEKVFTADKIDDHIWLGDIDSSENHEALDALNITHILTVLDFDPARPEGDRRIRKHVYAYDFHTTDLIGEFESCYQFIEQAVSKNENVLIHCHAGIQENFLYIYFA